MSLQTQFPGGMLLAKFNAKNSVALEFRAIHWLKIKMVKSQIPKFKRLQVLLWVYNFDFVTVIENDFGTGLGTHANPIDKLGAGQGAVRFYGGVKVAIFELQK